jgi:2-polyprenyl-3-methyl-5-hydroxy-6-metoxy-1,4-benzoquinol methylase
MNKKDGDLVKIPADYHYQASMSKNKIKRFWYYAKKTAIEEFLPPSPTDYVLDVGCGSGVITAYLAEKALMAVGIDGNLDAITFAQHKFGNNKTKFIHGLVDGNYEFDYLFDKIYCLELIEHIYLDQAKIMLKNFYKLLKKDGKLFITTPNYRSLWPLIEYLMDKFHLSHPLDKYQHVEHYNKQKLERILIETGFKVNFIKTNCFLAPWLSPISWNLALKLDRLEHKLSFGGSILIAVCSK